MEYDSHGRLIKKSPTARGVNIICLTLIIILKKRLDILFFVRIKFVNILLTKRGTSVILQGLFESIPVRYREFKKNIKREFGKALVLLQAYGIICENVRITCTNQSNNK